MGAPLALNRIIPPALPLAGLLRRRFPGPCGSSSEPPFSWRLSSHRCLLGGVFLCSGLNDLSLFGRLRLMAEAFLLAFVNGHLFLNCCQNVAGQPLSLHGSGRLGFRCFGR